MMTMINANFVKPDNQNSPVGDTQEKDAKPDEFMQILAGLCDAAPVPPTAPTMPPPPAVPTTLCHVPPNESVKDPEKPVDILPGNMPVNGFLPPDPNPAETADTADPLQPVELQPHTGPKTGSRDGQTGICIGDEQPATGGVKPEPSIRDGIKLIIKDIKTQKDKFTGVAGQAEPLSTGLSFAALTQQKEALLKALSNANAQVNPGALSSDVDISIDQSATHFDHTYITDADQFSLLDRDHSPRKLPKLISEVTEITAGDNAAISGRELPATERPALPKAASMAAAMMEQVEPKMMELAAATISNSKQVIKMRLHPAELGTVEIRLERNEAGLLDAHFKTDNESARHFLTKGLDQLRDSLQNAGWQIGQVEISHNTADAGSNSSQKDAWQQYDNFGENSVFKKDGKISDDTSQLSPALAASADRLVSLRA